MKWMRLVLGAVALLHMAAAYPAALVKRIKQPSFDVAQPIGLTITTQQSALAVQKFQSAMGGVSLIGDAIGSSLHDSRVEAQQASVSRLNDRLVELDMQNRVQSAAEERLAGVLDFATDPAAAPQWLTLRFDWYLTWEFRTLRLRMTAQSHVVDSGPSNKPSFHQQLYFDIRAPKMKGRRKDDQYMAYWADVEPDLLQREVQEGIDHLFAMLAFDLPRTYEIGPRKGRRYGIIDGAAGYTGVSIHELDGRRWVRATNGYLVNIPIE